MKIYVDADACPVVRIVEQAAREKKTAVTDDAKREKASKNITEQSFR